MFLFRLLLQCLLRYLAKSIWTLCSLRLLMDSDLLSKVIVPSVLILNSANSDRRTHEHSANGFSKTFSADGEHYPKSSPTTAKHLSKPLTISQRNITSATSELADT